jgi:hypothetical protein
MTIAQVTKIVRNAFDVKEMWCTVSEHKNKTVVTIPTKEKTFLIDIQEEKKND